MSPIVLVTGASGFVATHTVDALLKKGYTVIGTFRGQAKADLFKKRFNNPKLIAAPIDDVLAPGAIDDLLISNPDIKYVLHIASPTEFEASNLEEEFLKASVSGVKSILASLTKYANKLERFVYTSSSSTLAEKDGVFTEDNWNPITWEGAQTNEMAAYIGSKTFAERAAWEFFEIEKPSFSLSVILPVLIWGPQLFEDDVKETLNFSNEVINTFIKSTPGQTDFPVIAEFFIGVKDLAQTFIVAMEKQEAKDQRLVVSADTYTNQQILDVLNTVPEFKGKIATKSSDEGKLSKSDFSKSEKILGIKYAGLEEVVLSVANQIVEAKNKK